MSFLHGADYNYEQWLDRPEVLDQDFEGMKKAGLNVVSIGIFSWAHYEPRPGEYHWEWMDNLMDRLHQNGIGAILATPSGARPAWLSAQYPGSSMVDAQGHRAPPGGRHNHCRTSPDYRREVVRMNTLLAERYGKHPALKLWHVSNEYGSGRCYCDDCLEAFRTWLKKRYGTLDALNKAWWTSFWSHRFEAWDQIIPGDSSVTGMSLDWARFTSDQTLEFFLTESAPLRAITPRVPITTNFHGPDVGLDYHRFAPHVDIVSWDSYPRWHSENDADVAARTAFHHDLFRGMKNQPFLLMESTPSQTNWQGISPLKRPGLHEAASIQAVAHGSDSVQYFQWRQGRGGEETWHGSVLTLPGSFETRTFRDVATLGKVLADLSPWAGSTVPSQVALVFDFENHWALQAAQIPGNTYKGVWDEAIAWHRALSAWGLSVDVVPSTADLTPYRLVVAPDLYLLNTQAAASVKSFVEKGGYFVTGVLSAWVDENLLAHEAGLLGPWQDLLGIRIEEVDIVPQGQRQAIVGSNGRPCEVVHFAALAIPTTARVEATYQANFYAGQAAVTENRIGTGRAWYIGARTKGSFLQEFFGTRCHEAGIEILSEPLPEGVEIGRRQGKPGIGQFLINLSGTPACVTIAGKNHELPAYGWTLLTTKP